MNKIASFAATSLLAMMAVTANAQDAAVDLPSVDTVVATVNGTDITVGQLLVARAQLPQQYQSLPADVLFDGLVQQLIQQNLLAEQVEDLPLRAQVELDLNTLSIKAGVGIADLSAELVTDEAIQAAYDEMFAEFAPETEFNASHILVATEEEAIAAKARIDAGEDFAAVAAELSQDGSAANGGNLGWFGKGMMVEPFEAAVLALEPGAVSEPVQTQFGWHIVKLLESRPTEKPALETVRDQLAQQVQQQAIDARLAELEADADITRAEAGSIDPNVLTHIELLDQ